MTNPYDEMVDEVRSLIAALRQSWSWLGLLVEPGPESRLAPVLTDAQRARIARSARAERADRAGVRATGLGPLTERHSSIGAGALAASPVPVRLGVVDASARVQQIVLDAARAAAESLEAVYIGGSPARAVLDALEFLDGGPPCWIASTTGVIGRRVNAGVVDELGAGAILVVQEAIARADEIARAVAGISGQDTLAFPHPCPACGRRSLQWTMPSRDRRTWSVACIRETCRCAGHGCGCRQAVRYPGRRHAWAWSEIDGTWGLWRAIAAARRRSPRIRSAAAGHGGGPERSAGARIGTITVAGVEYIRQEQLLEQLGLDVTAAMLRFWARTRGINRIHLGREVWWPLHAMLTAEHETRTGGRGRRRRAARPPQ